MMYSEFILLASVGSVPEEDYEIIEKVYNYHPAVEDKQDMAEIYNRFGMAVIKDMLPRAEKLENLEEKLAEAKLQVDHLHELYRAACR